MKKIAIWGFGFYGRRMLNAINTWWDREIEVVRIYDLRADILKSRTENEGLSFATPDQLKYDYQMGLFESVMITVNIDYQYKEMYLKLKNEGIPVIQLGKEEDFHPASDFHLVKDAMFQEVQDGYVIHVFDALRGAVCVSPWSGIMFLFDETGKVLRDHWDAYDVRSNFTHKYDFPVRFDDPQLPTIMMRGEYCILAKLWSCNYWHFLFESMDCVQLLEELGYKGKYVISNWNYCKEVMLIYGIDDERILTVDDFEVGKTYTFEKVIYPKLINNDRKKGAQVLKRFSAHMQEKLYSDKENYPPRIYVERSKTRKLLNLDLWLKKQGFQKINPDNLPVYEQMQYFYNADLVLSPHGANSGNLLFMKSGTVLIETFGKNYIYYCNLSALMEKGIYYLPVVEGPVMPELPRDYSNNLVDYHIPEEQLECAVKVAESLLRTGHSKREL